MANPNLIGLSKDELLELLQEDTSPGDTIVVMQVSYGDRLNTMQVYPVEQLSQKKIIRCHYSRTRHAVISDEDLDGYPESAMMNVLSLN